MTLLSTAKRLLHEARDLLLFVAIGPFLVAYRAIQEAYCAVAASWCSIWP